MHTSNPRGPMKHAAAWGNLAWVRHESAFCFFCLPRLTDRKRPNPSVTCTPRSAANAPAPELPADLEDWVTVETSPELTFAFSGNPEDTQLLLATQYHLEQQQSKKQVPLQQQRHLHPKVPHTGQGAPQNEVAIVHRRLQPIHRRQHPQQQPHRQQTADAIHGDFPLSPLPVDTRTDRREQQAARCRRNLASKSTRPPQSPTSSRNSHRAHDSSGIDDLLQLLQETPTRLQRQRGGTGAAAAERLLEAYGPLNSALPFLSEEGALGATNPGANTEKGRAPDALNAREGRQEKHEDAPPLVDSAELQATAAELEALIGDTLKPQPSSHQQQEKAGEPEVELLDSLTL
ncbi:uncharacterized protein LOC34619154 [Cyclospora cayetanensis]|uniref:Uncharacterized protein LOC34619154 n=1 Tax=Cyclospora cayetanensis TaxID=88456 RepID=A0A6P6S0V5_9EIME|nr:uncharacterized protein LOC34619154 [Cyclospora cayetanensis]